MSKFFRFLVNVFLIAAILIAAAMLVPPLVGVSTTYVDSASMNTNLPFGSITYSRSVDVSTLKEGDEVLKEESDSTYAYLIKSGNASTGSFKVVSATDQSGSTQKIKLSGSVQKVAAVVPYIGYVMVALQSTEGILILILIVILNIILFILSVLWRPRTETEPEKKEEETEAPVVPMDDHNGIDTDVIRQAVDENNSEYANPSPDELIAASFDQKAENTASSEAEAKPAASAESGEETPDAPAAEAEEEEEEEQPAPGENEGAAAEADHEAQAAANDQEPGSAPEDRNLSPEAVRRMILEDESTNDKATDPSIPDEGEQKDTEKKLSWKERRAQKKARRKAAGNKEDAQERRTVPADTTSEKKSAVTGDTQEFIANLGATLRNTDSSQESGADSSYNNVSTEAETPKPAPAGNKKATAPDERQSEKVEFRDMPVERPYDPEHFVPVSRLTLDELLEQAGNNGDEPEVREDEATGITTVDYSKVI